MRLCACAMGDNTATNNVNPIANRRMLILPPIYVFATVKHHKPNRLWLDESRLWMDESQGDPELFRSSKKFYRIQANELMTFRLSLRKKLVYTFLGGSLLTVVLFSIGIKEIMNDYFQHLAEVRLQYVSELGQREIRTNVAIFKDAFQNIFDGMAPTVGSLAQSGAIGDHLPQSAEERRRMSDMLQRVQREAKISMFTVLDLQGRVIIRGNNPDIYGDETLMRDYGVPDKPVSSIRRLVLSALTGNTVQSFETFAPEILAKSDLAEQARIQLKTWRLPAPPNTFEERGLVMTIATPLRTSSGKLVGAVIAGRL